jgi:dTDP-4-dehydrorhamnose reductase
MLGSDLIGSFAPAAGVTGLGPEDLDITDAGACRAILLEHRPDVLINAAALTDVDYCESHEAEATRVNGAGAANLAQAATESQALLIHYSTDYVFDGGKSEPYVEEDPPNPLSAYGRSKLLGEQSVRSLARDHLILRTSWLFGSAGKNFIRTIIKAAQSTKQLRVVNDQRGSPTYTRDLAACTVRLVNAHARGVFHVTNSGSCTWFDLAAFALDCCGIPAEVQPVKTEAYPRPAPRPANSVLANHGLARAGLPPMRPWQQAVREYVRDHLCSPDNYAERAASRGYDPS